MRLHWLFHCINFSIGATSSIKCQVLCQRIWIRFIHGVHSSRRPPTKWIRACIYGSQFYLHIERNQIGIENILVSVRALDIVCRRCCFCLLYRINEIRIKWLMVVCVCVCVGCVGRARFQCELRWITLRQKWKRWGHDSGDDTFIQFNT